ncbi:MAG: hypothetical protein ACFFCS_22935 [Candidatus Hodarchaeota archaeon]
MVSFFGWLDGISAVGVILFTLIVGIYSVAKAIKSKLKLLDVFGIMIIFTGFLYLGPTSEFLCLLFTNSNMDTTYGLYGKLSYMWVFPALICAMYLGTEFKQSPRQKPMLITYFLLGIVFELLLFLDISGSFTFTFELENPGQDLVDAQFNFGSPAFILIAFFIMTILFYNGVGALRNAHRSSGTVRRKFQLFAVGFILFSIMAIFDALAAPGPVLFLIRIGMMSSAVSMYYVFK